jgi:hypothetical protein
LKWLHLKERTISLKERIKTDNGSRGRSNPYVGWTSSGNPKVRVGCGVIAARRSEYTNRSRTWLDTALKLVNSGKIHPGRNSGVIYSVYKCECTKLFERQTSEKLNPFKS